LASDQKAKTTLLFRWGDYVVENAGDRQESMGATTTISDSSGTLVVLTTIKTDITFDNDQLGDHTAKEPLVSCETHYQNLTQTLERLVYATLFRILDIDVRKLRASDPVRLVTLGSSSPRDPFWRIRGKTLWDARELATIRVDFANPLWLPSIPVGPGATLRSLMPASL
jgi:hypothetical protein